MAIVNPETTRGGAGVGTLLRKTREEEEERLARIGRPQAAPASPLRQLVRTTLLGQLPRGVAPVLRVRPEPEVVAPAAPARGVTPEAPAAPPGQGIIAREPTFARPPAMGAGYATTGVSMAAPRAVERGAAAQAAPPATTQPGGRVMGARARTPAPTTIGSRFQVGTPVGYAAEVKTPVPKTSPEFEASQTLMQDILGGIGKYGTLVTSALGLPQLYPGGIFAELQRRMAPFKKIRRWIPGYPGA